MRERVQPPITDDDLPARWNSWLRSYVTRVEHEVIRKLPDPGKDLERSWPY